MKIFHCKRCGKIITVLEDRNVPTICCGSEMQQLEANTTDASKEKHVPIIKEEQQLVTIEVGENLHPMEEDHYIHFIAIETKSGFQVQYLKSTDQPIAKFAILENDIIITAYAYCDKHGLWKQEMKK